MNLNDYNTISSGNTVSYNWQWNGDSECCYKSVKNIYISSQVIYGWTEAVDLCARNIHTDLSISCFSIYLQIFASTCLLPDSNHGKDVSSRWNKSIEWNFTRNHTFISFASSPNLSKDELVLDAASRKKVSASFLLERHLCDPHSLLIRMYSSSLRSTEIFSTFPGRCS